MQMRYINSSQNIADNIKSSCIFYPLKINNSMMVIRDFIFLDIVSRDGAPGRIRTADLPLRRGTRYPAEPPGHIYL